MRVRHLLLSAALIGPASFGIHEARGNPYPDPRSVPADSDYALSTFPDIYARPESKSLGTDGVEVIRVRIDWDAASDRFSVAKVVREKSGTAAFAKRSKKADPLGSYHGILRDASTREPIAYDSIGTGSLYRKLTRSLSFRFPVPDRPAILELRAENPVSGEIERVLEAPIDPGAVSPAASLDTAQTEVRLIKPAQGLERLRLNIYAEGYKAGNATGFWQKAELIAQMLKSTGFPGIDQLEIHGVFAPSTTEIGQAASLGDPVPERDSFLGLYFPYWEAFGRWYHVVYPTREERFRAAVASAPYDYPFALVDDSRYWGVGNYRELTAVPAGSSSLTYLTLHEIGHFFGLNEEYEETGRTELEFAQGTREPWSQNITFLRDPALSSLKWKDRVATSTALPSPHSSWSAGRYGAYAGGYAGSPVDGARSHKPGLHCVMESGPRFCDICRDAIEHAIAHDLGN